MGNKQFVEETKVGIGLKAQGRKVVESNDKFVLKEPYAPYNTLLDTEKGILRVENMYNLDSKTIDSIG